LTQPARGVIKPSVLDISSDHPLRAKGYTPLLTSWCVCVTDPCPCDDPDGPIIWILDGDVRKRVVTEHKNRSGEQLLEFHLEKDASVITETFTRIKAAALNAPRKRRSASGRVPPAPILAMAPGSSYGGQECGGGTLWDVWEEGDGAGGSTFYYVAVGSC
jgi:hypothetical protein